MSAELHREEPAVIHPKQCKIMRAAHNVREKTPPNHVSRRAIDHNLHFDGYRTSLREYCAIPRPLAANRIGIAQQISGNAIGVVLCFRADENAKTLSALFVFSLTAVGGGYAQE